MFDRDRRTTTLEHRSHDHREGPAGSAREHCEEVARSERVEELMAESFPIHFHCWSQTEFAPCDPPDAVVGSPSEGASRVGQRA